MLRGLRQPRREADPASSAVMRAAASISSSSDTEIVVTARGRRLAGRYYSWYEDSLNRQRRRARPRKRVTVSGRPGPAAEGKLA
jgi:hypothetical protein